MLFFLFFSLYEVFLYLLAFKEKDLSAVLRSWDSRAPSWGCDVQGQMVGLCPETVGQGTMNALFFWPTCIKLVIVLHNALAIGVGGGRVVSTFFAECAKLMWCTPSLTEILTYNSTQISLFK